MKLTLNWLKEFVTFEDAPEKLAELLTMAGLEVESITPLREPETNREDWLFEIAVTPNRGDCLGIAGLAREVAALTGARLTSPPAGLSKKDRGIYQKIDLTIEDAQLCRRYSARIVDEVCLGPSPAWLRCRLEACGIRSINVVVDVTNYVMLETGQPLHAFDLERLPSKNIVVRCAREIKKFTTLDGVERELAGEDLLICAGDTAVALAGVMGGMDAEVRATTRSVLLESANFAPVAIRRTAKRLALHSEASHRFERGVDPEGTVAALDRAVYWLSELAGGHALTGVADCYASRAKAPTLVLRPERIEKLLGVQIDRTQVEKHLKSLGMKTQRQGKSGRMKVTPPTSRPDLTREADLIEELARLHGYDNIPTTLPLLRCSGGKQDYRLGGERKVRAFLAGEGLAEVVNLPFNTAQLNRTFGGIWEGSPSAVAVLNPLAKESAEMRHSLVPGLIDNLRFNLAHKAGSFWAYHLGKVFRLGKDGESEERHCLAGLLYGPRLYRGLSQGEKSSLALLDCKGLVEGVLDLFRLSDSATWSAGRIDHLHPGRMATLNYAEKRLGYLGQLHPDVGDELGVPLFYVFELDFEGLLEYAPRRITVRALPRLPSVERDFAVVVDRAFPSQRILSWIKDLGEALIEHVQVFDQYLGAPIPEGKKSLAYKVLYRAEDRTLTDAEINALHQNLIDQVGKVFGAERRS